VIRRAEERDAARISEIYNQSIAPGTYATSQLTPDTLPARLAWLREHGDRSPAFVYDAGEQAGVLGWASLSPFSVRPRLRALAEVSLYVATVHRSQLVGARLAIELLVAARSLGLRSLVSLTFRKNTASLRGLGALGFRVVALVPEVCIMRGAWEDDVWLQKDLTVPDEPVVQRRIARLGAGAQQTPERVAGRRASRSTDPRA